MKARSLSDSVAELIAGKTESTGTVVHRSPVGGGCISNAEMMVLSDGSRWFVKSNTDPLPGMFEREAEGLAALDAVGVLRVPRPLGTGRDPVPFLVMEYIEPGRRSSAFEEEFGCFLALHHRASIGTHYGFDHDNYIGSTPQANGWEDDWPSFFTRHRLRAQLDLARKNGQGTEELARLGARLIDRLPGLLRVEGEPPVLIHGDLWSGNVLADGDGRPVLIDPAVYHAPREVEFGMISLFGGVGDKFHRAYNEVWPLPDGSADRIAIYRLYHLLNHLNLFGRGYLGDCLALMRRHAG